MQDPTAPPPTDLVPRWVRAGLYAVLAVGVGFAGLLSLVLGACDPRVDGAWCGGDLDRVGEGYIAGAVMTTLGFALAARVISRRRRPTLVAAAVGLALSGWFVAHVEALL